MTPTATKVPVGASTVAGLSTSSAAFISALVSAALGNRDAETMAAIGVGVVSLLSVVLSRSVQALAALRHAPAQAPTPPVA